MCIAVEETNMSDPRSYNTTERVVEIRPEKIQAIRVTFLSFCALMLVSSKPE